MKDPVSGGFVKTPESVTNAHVFMSDNTWRLLWEIGDDAVRKFGGDCVMIGTGQLVPFHSIKTTQSKDEAK